MAKYEALNVKKDSLSGLIQLISSFSQMGAKREAEKRYVGSFYDELNKGTKSFDNSEIEFHQKRAADYLNENMDKMDDVSIDRFQALNEQYEYQKQKNNDYAVSKSQIYDFKDNILSLADQYSAADDLSSFSWDTVTVNSDGELVTTTNSVDIPDDLNSEEYRQWFNDIGGVEGYVKKKEEYKLYLKNEIERSIGSYSDHQYQMMQKHGDRLTNRAFYGDVMEIEGLDKAYSFVIDSMTDDGLFDDKERAAFQSAIVQKKYEPIQNFIAQDREVRNAARNRISGEMDTLKGQGDILQSHARILDTVDAAMITNDPGFMKIEGQDAINLGTAKDPEMRTYGDIKTSLINKKQDDPLYQYLMSIESEQNKIKEELKAKDDAFMKNDGESYLQTMQDDAWTRDLYKKQPKGFIPIDPYAKKDITTTEVVDKGPAYKIDYSDRANVQPTKGGVWVKQDDGKRLFVKDEWKDEYESPTIIDTKTLKQEIFDKSNRPDYKTGFSGKLDGFLSMFNSDMKYKLKAMTFSFWKMMDEGRTDEANKMGQRISSLIDNKIKFRGEETKDSAQSNVNVQGTKGGGYQYNTYRGSFY